MYIWLLEQGFFNRVLFRQTNFSIFCCSDKFQSLCHMYFWDVLTVFSYFYSVGHFGRCWYVFTDCTLLMNFFLTTFGVWCVRLMWQFILVFYRFNNLICFWTFWQLPPNLGWLDSFSHFVDIFDSVLLSVLAVFDHMQFLWSQNNAH